MHQTPNFNSGIRATDFYMQNFDIPIFEKVLISNFFWYMRYINRFFNLKFNFKFNFRIYNWYTKSCIDLNFDLEWFLVHIHMIYRCMHKPKILYDLIHDSYMRYMITYLDHKIIFNIIYDLYMRCMISCIDLNFCLDLNFIDRKSVV